MKKKKRKKDRVRKQARENQSVNGSFLRQCTGPAVDSGRQRHDRCARSSSTRTRRAGVALTSHLHQTLRTRIEQCFLRRRFLLHGRRRGFTRAARRLPNAFGHLAACSCRRGRFRRRHTFVGLIEYFRLGKTFLGRARLIAKNGGGHLRFRLDLVARLGFGGNVRWCQASKRDDVLAQFAQRLVGLGHFAECAYLHADLFFSLLEMVAFDERVDVFVLLGELFVGADAHDAHEHVDDFLAHERQRPREDVHEVRQPVRVRRRVELANVHDVVLVLHDRRLVLVDVEIVRRGEDGDQRGKTGLGGLFVHPIANVLRFVGANDRQYLIIY